MQQLEIEKNQVIILYVKDGILTHTTYELTENNISLLSQLK